MKEDLTGKKFGRLTASKYLGVIDVGSDRRSAYECVCDCGNIKTVAERSLKLGTVSSCGCIRAAGKPSKKELSRKSSESNKKRRELRRAILAKYGYSGPRSMTDFFKDLEAEVIIIKRNDA